MHVGGGRHRRRPGRTLCGSAEAAGWYLDTWKRSNACCIARSAHPLQLQQADARLPRERRPQPRAGAVCGAPPHAAGAWLGATMWLWEHVGGQTHEDPLQPAAPACLAACCHTLAGACCPHRQAVFSGAPADAAWAAAWRAYHQRHARLELLCKCCAGGAPRGALLEGTAGSAVRNVGTWLHPRRCLIASRLPPPLPRAGAQADARRARRWEAQHAGMRNMHVTRI